MHSQGSKLVLSSSPGLSFSLEPQNSDDTAHSLETELILPLNEEQLKAHSTSTLHLTMLAEMSQQKDNAKIDHSVR